MSATLRVEYLAHGDMARWQAVSHVGNHGLPAAPVRYEDEAAARRVAADLMAAGLAVRILRVFGFGEPELVMTAHPAHSIPNVGWEHDRPTALERKAAG